MPVYLLNSAASRSRNKHKKNPKYKICKEFLIGTVLYKTKSLDGTKPNTNPNPNTNLIQLFYACFIPINTFDI